MTGRNPKHHAVAIVGMGPRGTYVLERLLAVLAARSLQRSVCVHLIEEHEVGAGLVYRTDQPEFLLMNTVASQITAYLDPSVQDAGPPRDGPSLYGWLAAHDAGAVGPDDYPSRAQHGRYLAAVVRDAIAARPPGVEVETHRCRAVDVHHDPVGAVVTLADGQEVAASKVVLTVGNVGNQDPRRSPVAGAAALDGLPNFIRSPYPVDVLANVSRDSHVGILGLGLTFIDVVVALTEGRGGRFVPAASGDGLAYVPSGEEPMLYAWSRSGLPLLSRGVNQKRVAEQYRARFLTQDAVRRLVERHGKLDFLRDVLPLLRADMTIAYYEALRGAAFAAELERAMCDGSGEQFLAAHRDGAQPFDWDELVAPAALSAGRYHDAGAYQQALIAHVRADLEEALRGNRDSPVKAACDTLRDLRDNIRYAVEYGGLTAASHRYFNERFTAVNNRLAVGPPARRTRELLALVEAGRLDFFFGPAPSLSRAGERFELSSTAFEQARRQPLDYVVDGRTATESSELVRRLVMRGAARLAVNVDRTGRYDLRTLEITRDGFLVDAAGNVDRTIVASGQVAGGTVWYPQVAARPGVNSRALREAGRAALIIGDALEATEAA